MTKFTLLLGCALLTSGISNAVAAPSPANRNLNAIAQQMRDAGANQFKAESLRNLKHEQTKAPSKVAAEWVEYKTASYTDDIIASIFQGVEPQTMTVTIEVDANDPTHYRIQEPYDTYTLNLEHNGNGLFEYYVYDDSYVYFTTMNTGLSHEGIELNAHLNVDVFVNEYGVEEVYDVYPDAFPVYTDGIITAPYLFNADGSQYPVMLVNYAGDSYAANRNSKFSIIPETEDEDPYTWNSLGTATYTDDFLASYIDGVNITTFPVEIQQDAEDPNHYRIVNPYAQWPVENFAVIPGVAEFYVYEDAYAYFTKFNTGVIYQGHLLEVRQNICAALQNGLTLETAIDIFPESLCKYEDGVLTATATFDNDGSPFSVFQIPIGDFLHRVNLEGAFRLVLPGAGEGGNWTTLGMGTYTDDFLASYLDDVEITTFEVEIQQDNEDENHYRIVNPYAQWPVEGYTVTPGMAEFYIYEDQYAYFTAFNTGVISDGNLLEVRQNICTALQNGLTLETAIELFPESLCKYENRVLTATTTFDNDGSPFSVFQIPIGDFLHRVNLQGEFRLEIPEKDPVNVETIGIEGDAAPVYYNLQGIRVENPASGLIIKVTGDKSEKVILK